MQLKIQCLSHTDYFRCLAATTLDRTDVEHPVHRCGEFCCKALHGRDLAE